MKVFISGSIKIRTLPQAAKEKLNNIINKNLTVLVGDANGIDKEVQNYLNSFNYRNVIVYYAGNNLRNNLGQWETYNVPSLGKVGREMYTLKDIQMALDSDYGLMIWDGQSKGTKKNIDEMLNQGKHFYVIQNNHLLSYKNFI